MLPSAFAELQPGTMETNDRPSKSLAARDAAPLAAGEPPGLADTRAVPRVVAQARVVFAPAVPGVPLQVSGMLLPGEHATLASAPHPFLFVAPILRLAIILALFGTALDWHISVVIRGHHMLVPLLSGPARLAVLAVGALAVLGQCGELLRRAVHYRSFRAIATNRRAFIVDGMLNRSVTPLGNTALAGATMAQGVFGRIFGFGTIVLPQNAGGRKILPGMRAPVELYREFQAVANGVDGDTWTPAVRNTIIP